MLFPRWLRSTHAKLLQAAVNVSSPMWLPRGDHSLTGSVWFSRCIGPQNFPGRQLLVFRLVSLVRFHTLPQRIYFFEYKTRPL